MKVKIKKVVNRLFFLLVFVSLTSQPFVTRGQEDFWGKERVRKLEDKNREDELKNYDAFNFNISLDYTSQLIVMLSVDFKDNYEQTKQIASGIIFGHENNRLFIVTAYHVVHRKNATIQRIIIRFKFMPDKLLKATLLTHASDGEIDMAVLAVDNIMEQGINPRILPFSRLAFMPSWRGKEVYPLGNPNGDSWAMPVVPDKIADVKGDEIAFQSAFISNGLSGGGLLDDYANITGMITADQPPFGRAIKIDAILRKAKEWGYPVQLETFSFTPPLHQALKNKDMVTFRHLLADCTDLHAVDYNDDYYTPLQLAAKMGNPEAVSLLLKAGADPNLSNIGRETPLILASEQGNAEVVSILLKAKADLTLLDDSKKSALSYASSKGNLECVELLIKTGANVNLQDLHGNTPLLGAFYYGGSIKLEVIRLLIESGTNVNARNDDGYTALHFALREKNKALIELLRAHGAKD